jgi:hypothetical protein
MNDLFHPSVGEVGEGERAWLVVADTSEYVAEPLFPRELPHYVLVQGPSLASKCGAI